MKKYILSVVLAIMISAGSAFACGEGMQNPCGGGRCGQCDTQRGNQKIPQPFNNPTTQVPEAGTRVHGVGTFQFPEKFSSYGDHIVQAYSRAMINNKIPGMVIVTSNGDKSYEITVTTKDEQSTEGIVVMIKQINKAAQWTELYSMTYEEFFPRYQTFLGLTPPM
jgi:hypothetical protein|tara:strand:+ start:38 stop:532 length:495 start_codon:yes stop_codon:yes gene_type:complete